MGVPCRLLILDQTLANGTALSRANAQVVRDAATVMDIEQSIVIMRMRTVRTSAPLGEPTTRKKTYGMACPSGAVNISCKSGSVAQIGMTCLKQTTYN